MGHCMSTDAAPGATTNLKQHVIGRRQRKKDLKKQAVEALTNEAKTDYLLTMIPGRMFGNGATNSACIFTQQGRKGTNQDAMVVWEGFASMEDTVFCGVFDGHGPFGHLVARRVRDSLPSKLVAHWQDEVAACSEEMKQNRVEHSGIGDNSTHTSYGSNVSTTYESAMSDGDERDSLSLERREMLMMSGRTTPAEPPAMFGPWKEAHLTAYREMDQELRNHPFIDCFCSGTTTVTVLKQGKDLVIGNVGDSRAIMGTQDDNGVWGALQLTVDLKPNLPKEAERIRECKGRVFALHDEPEVSRVWLPHDNSPGLAMARAFGDFCLKDYGVIAVPEISYHQLTDHDRFLILATDGIWDVLTNEEVVQMVASAPTRSVAARSLVESAVRNWRHKYPTSKVDDCAVVCLYLDNMAVHSATEEKASMETYSEPTDLMPSSYTHHIHHHPRRETSANIQTDARAPPNKDEGPKEIEEGRKEIEEGPKEIEPSASRRHRSLAEWMVASEAEEWHALEGIVRVNSLVGLPRFQEGDRRAEGQPRRAM